MHARRTSRAVSMRLGGGGVIRVGGIVRAGGAAGDATRATRRDAGDATRLDSTRRDAITPGS